MRPAKQDTKASVPLIVPSSYQGDSQARRGCEHFLHTHCSVLLDSILGKDRDVGWGVVRAESV